MQKRDPNDTRHGLAASGVGDGLSRDPAALGGTSEVNVFSPHYEDEGDVYFVLGI